MHCDQTDCCQHNDQTDGDLHNDQTDGDLHNAHTLIFKFTYPNFGIEIKVEIKIIQYVCTNKLYKLIILHSHILSTCVKDQVNAV